MKPDISVVVPLHNEAPNVLPLAQRVLAALDHALIASELILVDDGSADDTWKRVLEAQQFDPRVRGLRHGKNAGQSAALWTGFKHCRAEVIGTLDGDLQNDPADLPRLSAELLSCDMVCGVRIKRMDNWLRRVSSGIARIARKKVLGVDFRDSGCNLRVFKATLLKDLPAFDGIHRFMPILVQAAGATVKEVPVDHHPRTAGKSNYGVWNRLGRGIYDLLMVRWLMKRQLLKPAAIESSAPALASPQDPEVAATGTPFRSP